MQEKGVKKGQKAPRILSRFGFPSFFVLGSFSGFSKKFESQKNPQKKTRFYRMPSYMPKSKNDKWGTPKELYNKWNDEFHFNYDPCPIEWKEGDADGLTTEWGSSTFCNPPYSKTADWIQKAHSEWKKGKNVVMLINAITDTKAFHKYIYNQAEIRFLQGRIKFVDYTDPKNPITKAPNVKASMLVIFSAT